MGMVKCKVCGEGDSIAFCAETGVPLCANCAVSCEVCYTPISREVVNLTSTGRKLCKKCMAERNARRKAQKERLKREAVAKKAESAPAPPSEPAPPSAEADTGFSSLTADENDPVPLSFDALTADEEHVEGEDQFAVRDAREEEDEREDEDDERKKKSAASELSPEAQERSNRLELGPIDENRPILTGSGYQAPAAWKYAIAFLLFGIGGALFLTVSPELRDLMWPYRTPPLQFARDQITPVSDTNTLRDTSNVSQLDIFSQGPIFLITWTIVLAYTIGSVLIIIALIRSAISSYLAKRRLKYAQEEAQKDQGFSFPG